MMQKPWLIIWMAILLIATAQGQTRNRRDAAGRKQGYWEAVDHRGALVYSGYFTDDRPVGEMKRYYPTGGVRVAMHYTAKSDTVRARFFWQSGELAACGNYIETRRDSVWLYYSNRSKALSHRVVYANGKHHGKEQRFYPDGSVAEEIVWENDMKNGAWTQYFNNGQVKSSATYQSDLLEGAFTAFSPEGKKEIEGAYRRGIPDGEWKRYDEKGKLLATIRYADGKITNPDEVDAFEQEYFRKMIEQAGNIPEPTIEDLFRQTN